MYCNCNISTAGPGTAEWDVGLDTGVCARVCRFSACSWAAGPSQQLLTVTQRVQKNSHWWAAKKRTSRHVVVQNTVGLLLGQQGTVQQQSKSMLRLPMRRRLDQMNAHTHTAAWAQQLYNKRRNTYIGTKSQPLPTANSSGTPALPCAHTTCLAHVWPAAGQQTQHRESHRAAATPATTHKGALTPS